MIFLIKTAEVYHMAYQLEADTPEQALHRITEPDGVRYLRPDARLQPARIEVLNIEAVITPKEEAA